MCVRKIERQRERDALEVFVRERERERERERDSDRKGKVINEKSTFSIYIRKRDKDR